MLRRLVGMDTVHALISRFLRTRLPPAVHEGHTRWEKGITTVRVVYDERVGGWGKATVVTSFFLTS